ncbi:MAG: hypothetical protein ACTSVD_02785 [Candidatus Thorarchaeota archaeon]|nr:MAG: hypothetical protein DRO93_05000 [Candidatus Thorarchaeota archaeon]
MGIHVVLRSVGGIHWRRRVQSTTAYGFRLLRSMVANSIITNVQLGQVFFRGVATVGGETYLNGEAGWIDRPFSGNINDIVETLGQIMKKRNIRFPYFRPETLATTIVWTANLHGEQCTGYLILREPRAEDAKTFGNIEIDIMNTGEVTQTIAQVLRNTMKQGEDHRRRVEAIASVLFHETDEPHLYGFKIPYCIVITDDSKPFIRFDRAYVFGLSSARSLPRFFRELIESSVHELLGSRLLRGENAEKLFQLEQVFSTVRPSLLTSVLRRETTYERLLGEFETANIAVSPGSIIVSNDESLEEFLEVLISVYGDVLSPIYKIVRSLREELENYAREA